MESASQLNNQQSTVIAGNAYRIHQNSVPEVYSISQLLNIVTYIQTIIINHNQTYKQISKLDLDSNLIGNQLKVITRDFVIISMRLLKTTKIIIIFIRLLKTEIIIISISLLKSNKIIIKVNKVTENHQDYHHFYGITENNQDYHHFYEVVENHGEYFHFYEVAENHRFYHHFY